MLLLDRIILESAYSLHDIVFVTNLGSILVFAVIVSHLDIIILFIHRWPSIMKATAVPLIEGYFHQHRAHRSLTIPGQTHSLAVAGVPSALLPRAHGLRHRYQCGRSSLRNGSPQRSIINLH